MSLYYDHFLANKTESCLASHSSVSSPISVLFLVFSGVKQCRSERNIFYHATRPAEEEVATSQPSVAREVKATDPVTALSMPYSRLQDSSSRRI